MSEIRLFWAGEGSTDCFVVVECLVAYQASLAATAGENRGATSLEFIFCSRTSQGVTRTSTRFRSQGKKF